MRTKIRSHVSRNKGSRRNYEISFRCLALTAIFIGLLLPLNIVHKQDQLACEVILKIDGFKGGQRTRKIAVNVTERIDNCGDRGTPRLEPGCQLVLLADIPAQGKPEQTDSYSAKA